MEIYGNSRNSLSQKSRKSLILLIINDGNIYKACGVPAGMSHFWAFIWHSVSAVPLIRVTIQSLPLGADSPVTWYQVTPPTHSANCSAIHHFYNLRVMHNKSQVNNKWAQLWGVRSEEWGERSAEWGTNLISREHFPSLPSLSQQTTLLKLTAAHGSSSIFHVWFIN